MTVFGFNTIGITVGDLVDETIAQLGAGVTQQMNKVAEPLDAAETDVVFTYDLEGLVPGTIFEVDDELFYVWATNEASKSATVQRGYNGSVAATHATGALAQITPRFPRVDVLKALRSEIRSWPVQLHGVLSLVAEAGITDTSIELTGLEFYTGVRLLDATVETLDTDNAYGWPALGGARLVAGLSAGGFIDGYELRWPFSRGRASNVRIILGAAFNTGIFTSDIDLGLIGLTETMADIAPIGATMRLLYPTEVNRTDTSAQGGSRTAEETPPGHAMQTARGLREWRGARISEEVLRLASQYGWREG